VELVIDTSALIAVIANEPEKPVLIECTEGAELVAPASVHWEIGNAFSAMLRRSRITLAQARQALAVYRQIPVRFLEVDLDRALELVDELGIYAYDAYLITAAQQLHSPLLTLDGGLLRAAKGAGVEVLEVNR
jgi:predicted nucleic acid-binding protein